MKESVARIVLGGVIAMLTVWFVVCCWPYSLVADFAGFQCAGFSGDDLSDTLCSIMCILMRYY